MALDRNALADALFDHLQNHLVDVIVSFKKVDLGGESIPRANLPLLVLRVHSAEAQAASNVEPPEWRLRYSLVIYMLGSPTDQDPDSSLQYLASCVEAALEKKPGDGGNGFWTTLGGRCLRAYPVSTEYDAGEAGAIKVAGIGVEIVAFPPAPGRPPAPPA